MKETIDLLKKEFPDKASDLVDSMEIVKDIINSTIEEISSKVTKSMISRDVESIETYNILFEKGVEYENLLQDIISNFANDDKNKQKILPNYIEYEMYKPIEYSLNRVWKHKRPLGFKFLNDNIEESNTWIGIFIKTCEILYRIDSDKFNDLENIKEMNGKKRKHFCQNNKNLRRSYKILDGIYIETNHSADTIRSIIKKLLKEFGYKDSDYKVYLRSS